MCAMRFDFGHVCTIARAVVQPSADWMLVSRKTWCGFGTALSKRKSVQPSTNIVSTFSSSATGPSAGVLPLEVMPQKKSMFSESFRRRSSFTLASVPAFSSALSSSIFRLPSSPPVALISSAASCWPLNIGSPSTAAGPVKKVIWPILNGLSGMFPFGLSCACATPTIGMVPPAVANAAPTLTPRELRKLRRSTSPAMVILHWGERLASRGPQPVASFAQKSRIVGHIINGRRTQFPTRDDGGGPVRAVTTTMRGLGAAVRARPGAALGVLVGVLALHVFLPPLLLAVTRKPWTYFAFNPWLRQLPRYLISSVPLDQKFDFLSRVAVFWFTADGPYGFPEWGFAVDAADLARFLVMSALVAAYFALVLYRRDQGRLGGWRASTGRAGGIVGAFAGVLGLSTGPCSVVGCGAPVLPVVGLVFAGLSSGTLALLSGLSRLMSLVVLVALTIAVAWLGWQTGTALDDRPRRLAARSGSDPG